MDQDPYSDQEIPSNDAQVPKWLKWVYWLLPIWGIVTFFVFWNGSTGWLDGGQQWRVLQKAADTRWSTRSD